MDQTELNCAMLYVTIFSESINDGFETILKRKSFLAFLPIFSRSPKPMGNAILIEFWEIRLWYALILSLSFRSFLPVFCPSFEDRERPTRIPPH